MDLSGIGQNLVVTKEDIKNLASNLTNAKKEIHDLKKTNGSLLKTNSETLNEIRSSLNEKFIQTQDFELELSQFKQKSRTDENEIKTFGKVLFFEVPDLAHPLLQPQLITKLQIYAFDYK